MRKRDKAKSGVREHPNCWADCIRNGISASRSYAVGQNVVRAGSYSCPRFKIFIGRSLEILPIIDSIIDRCEITVFFPNCLKKVVFITSSNSMSFKPSTVFISLRHCEAIILDSGMHLLLLDS